MCKCWYIERGVRECIKREKVEVAEYEWEFIEREKGVERTPMVGKGLSFSPVVLAMERDETCSIY